MTSGSGDASGGDEAAAASAVRARGVRVTRGGRVVVQDVSFELRRGSITGLLGPSGCGKSTLMRAIVGVQEEVAGVLEVLGAPAGEASLRPRVGYVTQAPSVYQDLSVRENLDYFGHILGAGRARQDEVIETVGLTKLADSTVDRLSGGERARVSLATALLNSPELLVLDEPTVGLDPVLRRDLWRTFRVLAAGGVTLLISSHVMDEADRCDEILLMRDGRLIASGEPKELLRRTNSETMEAAFLHLVEAAEAGAETSDKRLSNAVVQEATRRSEARALPKTQARKARVSLLSTAVTGATAQRVLRQLRRDPRTLALLMVVPLVLMALMRWVFSGFIFQRIGVPLVGIYPLVLMFLVTSVTMLRERVTGTLERLMTMPLSRLDLVLGYGLAFGVLACVQAAAVSLFAFGLLGLDTSGPIAGVVALAILNAILGMALGLFVSAFARSEFQAVQFMPAVILPQIFLCGLMAPREAMARPLELLSYLFPLTYSYEALRKLAAGQRLDGVMALDIGIVVGSAMLALTLGAATLRRRTA